MQGIALPHQQRLCVCCCTTPCASLCAAVLCPQTIHPTALLHPRTDPTSLYMDYPEAIGQLPMLTLQPDQEEKVHTPHGHMTVMHGYFWITCAVAFQLWVMSYVNNMASAPSIFA